MHPDLALWAVTSRVMALGMAPEPDGKAKGRARGRTGPRTVAGKKRASRNARRHGLSISAGKDSYLSPDVERLASAVAGATPDGARLEYARAFAEAEFDLRRVRAARFMLLNPPGETPSVPDLGSALPYSLDQKKMNAILENLPQALRLERYERRAMSRWKKALRALRGSMWTT